MKNNQFYIWPFLLVITIFSGCNPEHEDVGTHLPFSEAVGKSFVLQRDLYVYKFNDSSLLQIGPANNMPPDSIGVPDEVNEKFIGLNTDYLTLEGVVKKGSVFTISKILYKKDYYFPLISYRVHLINNPQFQKQEIDTMQILQLSENPPLADSWATPPIFNDDMALPLASDGEWWKNEQ